MYRVQEFSFGGDAIPDPQLLPKQMIALSPFRSKESTKHNRETQVEDKAGVCG